MVDILANAGTNLTAKGYGPDVIHVVIGVNSTIMWMNNDSMPHTVTSDSGVFDSGEIAAGHSWNHTFTAPGTYTYHCTYHYWMTGTVVATAGQ